MVRRIVKTIRLNERENRLAREGYEASGSQAGYSGYLRELMTGETPHPNYEEEHLNRGSFASFSDVGELNGVEDVRNHYLAVVVAAIMLRVRMDPEYRQYMKGDPKTFKKLVNDIRGYEFDDKTATKSPLRKNLKYHQDDRR